MKRWLIRGSIAVVVLAALGLAGVIGVIYHYSADLPDNKALAAYVPPITTRLHASNGDLMAEYAAENRVFLPIEEIPPLVKQAFLAAEDNSFYHHNGLDFKGLIRAAVLNAQSMVTGRRLVGGSTITQQVAKNFSLTGEVSYDRKIKEAILAYRIESALPKDKILELYLNHIYLGAGAYGVVAASSKYFGRPLDELTIEQAAYLAALPKAPSNYHPIKDHDLALARRNWVIGRMFDDQHITYAAREAALKKPLVAPNLKTAGQQPAPWFAEQVRRELVGEFKSKTVNEGGLSVRTTMDPALQAIAQRVLREGLETYDRRHGYRGPLAQLDPTGDWKKALGEITSPDPGGPSRIGMVTAVTKKGATVTFADDTVGDIPFAEMKWAGPYTLSRKRLKTPKSPAGVMAVGDAVLVKPVAETAKGKAYPDKTYALTQAPDADGGIVAIDPFTGRVLAMVGGYNAGRSEFNRAVQAVRQPGSAFKPFVYLTALNNGYTPSSTVLDAPFVQRDNLVLGSGWKPGNYSSGKFYGPSPLRLGIELSRNLMTVRLANDIGMDKIAETANRFGVINKMDPVLAMALGSGETTLLKITTAYGMLVNGGLKIKPAFIDRVQDRTGATLRRLDDRACEGCSGVGASLDSVPLPPVNAEQVDDPISIFQLVLMMQGVIDRGTATKAKVKGVPLAGKTGTTNDALDAWFVGFSSDLAVGVFVGFDTPRTLGPSEAGGLVAAPIFGKFMKEAASLYPTQPFRAPPGVRLMQVSSKTGALAGSGGGVITQAFRPGTEPTSEKRSRAGGGGNKKPATAAGKARKTLKGLY
jgi:penicillin-binding protein 1A